MRIYMREGDAVTIELPGGAEISLVVVSPEDADCLPELDMVMSAPMVANCWSANLAPGIPLEDQPWSVECVQICIPIVPSQETANGS